MNSNNQNYYPAVIKWKINQWIQFKNVWQLTHLNIFDQASLNSPQI